MSVIGFDIGNENCVIAVAQQRGIDVLLNDESKRETPSVVSFGEKQRFMGSTGAAAALLHPKSTLSQIKRLIGRSFECPSVKEELSMLPFETSQGPDGGILIHLCYLDEMYIFTPVQILAMLFGHLKQITEKNLEMQIADCVLGIPSYFTDAQRRAYLYAAEIAGLMPLRLMHDCTATALGYAIYKTEYPHGDSVNAVFVDIGHCDTQVAVVSFNRRRMTVLSHASDSNLGGRDFDEVLFRYFAVQFREQYKIDVYSSIRASTRLRASCEKLKKVLSANTEAPLNIECLMDEKDVTGFIKRDDFENLSSGLIERIGNTCRLALRDSGLTLDKIHTVELVGSGSRVPAITKMLTFLFRREPSRTLNASECVARGCAIQCAMLSPIYRALEYEVEDRFPFCIGFTSEGGSACSVGDQSLFPKGSPFPSTKLLKLQRNDVFALNIFCSNQNEIPSGVSPRISSSKIVPFRVSHAKMVKIKIKVQLNLHGIVTVDSATLLDDHLDDSLVTNNDTNSELEPGNQESFGKSSGHEMRRLKAVRRQNILIDENKFSDMTQPELFQAREQELQLAQQDVKMEMTKEKKNAVEAFVYETRNKLMDKYRNFASTAEREGISGYLQQTEEWLYDEGEDESESIYTKRLEELQKLVDPIETRCKEEEARELAIRNLLDVITECRTAARTLPSNERETIRKECKNVEDWLDHQRRLQDPLPKNVDPLIWSDEINKKAQALDEKFKRFTRSKHDAEID